MQYIGIKGNTHYLLDRESKEAYIFTDLGTAVDKCSSDIALIETKGKCQEIDILSILGEQGAKVCEVYFNNRAYTVESPYLDVYAKLSSHLNRHSHIIYTIKHPERVKQILIPLVKNSLSDKSLRRILGVN